MLPAFKEVVEELFVRGLVKAVFATETLALGINMPARCVVLERLVKFNGEAHVDLTPGEYTQLTGRAGRRGIDVEGHAVVVWSPEVDPRHVAGLASTRTYPLRSSFRPSYNMAVNLVGSVGRGRRRASCWSRSFAQFQADRSVVGLARQVQRNEETHGRATRTEMACDLGDFAEYFALRRRASPSGRRRWPGRAPRSAGPRPLESLERLQRRRRDPGAARAPGRAGGRARPGRAAGFGEPRPLVLTEDRWAGRISGGRLHRRRSSRWPGCGCRKHFNHRSPQERRDLASPLRNASSSTAPARGAAVPRVGRRRRRRTRRGCARRCAGTRATPARSGRSTPAGPSGAARLERDTEALRGKVANRTGSLARTFDRVCALLDRPRLPGRRRRR